MSHFNDELSYPGSKAETPDHFSCWSQAKNYARGCIREILNFWDAEDIIEAVVLTERQKLRNRDWKSLDEYLRYLELRIQYHELSAQKLQEEHSELEDTSH